jgi:hypothetical protein
VSPTFVRRALTVLILGITLGTCSACFPQGPTLHPFTNPSAGGADRVVLFGDSLAAMSQQPASAIFANDPTVSLSYNATGGTRFQHWTDAYANVTSDDIVILELGTNNVSNEAINTGELPGNMHAALAALSSARCVVMPTLNTTGGDLRGFPYDQRTRWVNDELARLIAAGTYPNLRSYDWAAESAGHTEWLMGTAASPADWVHGNTAGTTRYAEMLVDTLGACR